MKFFRAALDSGRCTRFGFALTLFCSTAGYAEPRAAETYRSLTDDGGWCWFADPRALRRGAITYTGWVTNDGSVQAAALDGRTGKVAIATLHEKYQRDDHDNPAFLFLKDGRLLALYSKHGGPDMNARVTTRPGDVSSWEPERVLDLFGTAKRARRSVTYPNPVRLSAEADAIYLFWRGDAIKPTFSRSTDDGATWSPARELVARHENAERNRPYVKIASNGRDRIHVAFTDGHPNIEPTNGLYYLCYRAGELRTAGSRTIAKLTETPITPDRAERIYDGQAGRAWVWDVAADAQDRPVIVYVRIPDTNDHRYHYARWDGTRWEDHEVCAAGKWFPQTPAGVIEREPFYSGGIVLDPSDPSIVYVSRPVNGVREIERWITRDGGRTWRGEPITRGSAHDNIRPVVIRGDGAARANVLWINVRDHFTHFTDYLTAIKIDAP